MNQLLELISHAINQQTFIRCIWSNPRRQEFSKKITLKPVIIKKESLLQLARTKEKMEYHENITQGELEVFLQEEGMAYKQVQLYTSTQDYQILLNKKGEAHIKKQPPTLSLPASLSHNRQKNYILDTPSSAPFLKALGLMDENGQIKPSKYDKYKQINRYLEIVSDSLCDYPMDFLRIVDFGCGKSYLTFALYHYLTVLLGKKVEIIGLDLKEDVIAFCNDLAKDLDYSNLHFQVGDIGKYTTNQQIDMVVSLHACNTATDAALEKAILWGTKIIFAVPCCHHEAYTQIENSILSPILKHGILKERIAALVTDGLRAQLLEAYGYKVNLIEFVDMAHTPKNILMKAILKSHPTFNKESFALYQETAHFLNLNLCLERSLKTKK